MTEAAFRLTDSTLRDGSHALSHRYTTEQVASIVRGLDAAGVPVIEVSHGDGLGGSSFNYGFSGTDERDLVSAAVAAATRARIAVLLLPGIGVADDLRDMADRGVAVARIATHCTEADISEQHIRLAKRLGMELVMGATRTHGRGTYGNRAALRLFGRSFVERRRQTAPEPADQPPPERSSAWMNRDSSASRIGQRFVAAYPATGPLDVLTDARAAVLALAAATLALAGCGGDEGDSEEEARASTRSRRAASR